MQYLLTFLEGLASFISPCLLPMIPLYLSYFAGSDDEEGNTQTKETTDENIVVTADENIVATADVQPKQVKKRKINGKVIVRALSFVLGFTLMFVFFGGLVGLVGGFLTKGKTIITIAHRLATIKQADQILVVSEGRIAEAGTHAELVKKTAFISVSPKSAKGRRAGK